MTETDDHPLNRRGFKYKPAATTKFLNNSLTTDIEPYGPRFSHFDRSYNVILDKNMLEATNPGGWHSVKSNIGISEGNWYFEYEIVEANTLGSDVHSGPHVRVGIGRREAAILTPVGYDAYGYSVRDIKGDKIHLSRPTSFMNDEKGFMSGDVIGFHVQLPSLAVQQQIARDQVIKLTQGDPYEEAGSFESRKRQKNPKETKQIASVDFTVIQRDQAAISYKGHDYFEQFEYVSTAPFEHLLNPVTVFGERAVKDSMPFRPATLPGSKIDIYKNGVNMGTAFENLYAFLPPSSKLSKNQFFPRQYNNDGSLGYYPMASVFKGGKVRLNPGPELSFVPEDLRDKINDGYVRMLCERYEEQIAEDIVYDIVQLVEEDF